MHPQVVVIIHDFANLLLKLPGQVIVLQVDNILQGPMIALDLALGHGMIGPASGVADATLV